MVEKGEGIHGCDLPSFLLVSASSSSSSSSSNESDLGGAITLLLQDHRTTNKSVCKQPEHSKQFML